VADDLINQLSDMQRTCLRLVARGRSSKEIALETGLSHQTVDQYVSRAVAILGVANRREAARRLSELETETFNKVEFKSEAVAASGKSSILNEPIGNSGERGGWQPSKWIPGIGGSRHDLDRFQIFAAILRISLLTMGTAGAIIAIVFWLNRLMA
jgi:DNA-binding CsgD family transcriptional regulator